MGSFYSTYRHLTICSQLPRCLTSIKASAHWASTMGWYLMAGAMLKAPPLHCIEIEKCTALFMMLWRPVKLNPYVRCLSSAGEADNLQPGT